MPERQQLLEDICLRALETDPPLRAAFLREACPDDAMRIEVESLLASADYAEALFWCRRQSSRAPTMVPARSLPGRRPARRSGQQKLPTSDSDRNHDLTAASR